MAAFLSTSGSADAHRHRLAGLRRRHQPQNVPEVFRRVSGFPETSSGKMLAAWKGTTGCRTSSKLGQDF